jgi:hypothetical protein
MFQDVFQLPCGSFVSIGHYVRNFNTVAVVVGSHTDSNGEVSPVLREVGANNKLVGGKWVANTKFCSKA